MRPLRWCATAVGVALIASVAMGGCTSAKSKALVDATPTFEFSGTAATVNGEDIPAQLIADQIEADKIPQVAQVALGDPDVLDAHTGQVKPTVVAALIETEIAVKLSTMATTPMERRPFVDGRVSSVISLPPGADSTHSRARASVAVSFIVRNERTRGRLVESLEDNGKLRRGC